MKKEKKTIEEKIKEAIKKELPEIHGRRVPKKLKKTIEFLIVKTLQRFIEETRIKGKEMKDIKWYGFISEDYWRGFKDAIKLKDQKQAKWLKNNL